MYSSPKWSLRLGLWDKEDYRNIMQKILYMESNPNEIVTELTVEPHESDFGKVVLHVFGCGADKLIIAVRILSGSSGYVNRFMYTIYPPERFYLSSTEP